MPFERILVAIDGSDACDRAFAKAVELAALAGARLTALAIEGPLPAYAATIGEVEEVKREKDVFFRALAAGARERAEQAGVAVDVELRAGHAAEAISDFAAAGGYDLVVLGHRGHFLRDHLLGSTADRVALAEPMGAEVIAHFALAADGERQRLLDPAAGGETVLTARLSPRSAARTGEPLRVAIDVERLHFFDVESGTSIW